jgi:hypothetical protein
MADTQPKRLYAQLKGPGEPQFPSGSAALAAKVVFVARPNNEERFNSISLLWQ